MNCQNCGAPMRLIEDREYFFCQYCGSFHFPNLNADGLRLLEEPSPRGLKCPICHDVLIKASIMRYPVLHCEKCRGSLVAQFIFGEAVKYLRTRAKGPADSPRLLNKKELERHLYCPECGELMHTHPYAGPGNIIIDTCSGCGLIWLDYGELNQVVNAPGRDRHQPWYLDD